MKGFSSSRAGHCWLSVVAASLGFKPIQIFYVPTSGFWAELIGPGEVTLADPPPNGGWRDAIPLANLLDAVIHDVGPH
tara:strand:+ start:283 stop:516 length:234 start_codon:yes stop_codon:yes gene_type:complete